MRRIARAHSTWHTRQGVPGTWNASYDIWFGRHRATRGHADGAELMIWLNHHGNCCVIHRDAPTLRIAGGLWRLQSWRPCDAQYHVCWNYIQFRLVHARWRVDGLNLKAFIRVCERRGLIRRSWWMENVEAGFEIWSGGAGLATTEFRVHVKATAS